MGRYGNENMKALCVCDVVVILLKRKMEWNGIDTTRALHTVRSIATRPRQPSNQF